MGTGKKKIEIKKIEKDSARMVTFSKRRQGLFKKARDYAAKTSSQVAILVFSPAGKPFVQGSPCFDDVIERFMVERGQDGGGGSGGGDVVERGQDSGGRGGGGELAGGGRQIEEFFTGLEERMSRCESVEELMELSGELEDIRDKVLERLTKKEDDFVASFFS
ncbi:hypothetical protein LWI28_012946 [Acer negundo]|uniref:MADS-box domain-containing protein n=1 Tax=Acer negundo TaxID=4023 RepID=A0AAD5JIR1_ACENE|nr:hypothetical protein LWI28_012946 [Acer negundo]KAK4853622.1 hypothetical protein QYF36_011798 [Acer negundo]